MRVLLTGSTGFVGRGLLKKMVSDGYWDLVTAVRSQSVSCAYKQVESLTVAELGADTDWRKALKGVDAVIHCAARAHVIHENVANPLAAFRKVNVEGTMSLARQAARAGVRRFIFISTIKVNGEGTLLGVPYVSDTPPAPMDPYGVSKMEAEMGLRALAAETGMEVVIIRPALVYGPGVKANFLSMMRILNKGIPLPLGAIYNRRSLVALDNLVDLILICIDHPDAANQTFLVSDGDDLSTTELLRRMAMALGRPARLLPVPSWMLERGAAMLGKKALSQRLCGSLQVDIGKTREVLGWTPPVSVDLALEATAKHFLELETLKVTA